MPKDHRGSRPGRPVAYARLLALLVTLVALPAVPITAQDVELALRFRPGDVDVYRMTQTSMSASPVGVTTGSQTTRVRQEVVRVGPNGTAEVRYTYEAVRSVQEGPQGRQEYDSEIDPEPTDPYTSMLAGMVGASFVVTTAPDGTVHSVTGVDEFVDRMIVAMAGDEPDRIEEVRALLKPMFGSEQMKSSMQQSMHVFPAGTVRPGDEWEEDISVALPFGTMRSVNRYRLEEVVIRDGRRVARIGVTGHSGGLEVASDHPLAMLDLELTSADVAGDIEFDLDHGRLIRVTTTTDVAMDAMGMDMDLQSELDMQHVEDSRARP